MKASVWFGFLLSVLVPINLAGCSGGSGTTPKGQPEQKDHGDHKDPGQKDQAGAKDHEHGGHAADEADIKTERAKLSPEDQRLVAEQEFCPIMDDHRLGVMGVPVKLMLNDKPVFVCCK